LEDAEKKLAEVTETLELRYRTGVLDRILQKAHAIAREQLSDWICAEANQRIHELMPNNHLQIQSVGKCLNLRGQEGASMGETLSVAYAFLSTLFHRTEHQLPFVVDSPAGPIDLKVRERVAQLIPKLASQFIAFTISTEREGFLEPLETIAPGQIQYLTLFRKGPLDLERKAKKHKNTKDTVDGFIVPGKEFFKSFHLTEE